MADYTLLRRVQYPPINHFLEALHDKEKGNNTKYNAWIAACDKVKSDFPKGD